MKSDFYLGMMSGTSLDGVDLALMDFATFPPKLTACEMVAMPVALREALTLLLKGETSLQNLGEIDHQLGKLYADCVNQFLAKNGLKPEQIQAIGCHGQTVWHAPTGENPFTMQIGDMHYLAAKTDITVVGDFRRKDMAMGGQGAPLVPAFHEGIFAAENRLTVVLNIGGISNISVLAPNQPTIGYDVGVGNALLDAWIEQHQGKRYDKNGAWASSGKVLEPLLAALLDEPFFQQPPPKSTGRELFNLKWLVEKIAKVFPNSTAYLPQDIQRTLVEFTVQGIAHHLKLLNSEKSNLLLICGGGVHNLLILNRLSEILPDWTVASTSEYGLDADYVEAAAFAWLAYRRMHNLPSNLPSVTGASRAVSLGAIYPKNE